MWVKRAFDIAVSLFILVVFSPLLLLLALFVRLKLGSPIFFTQARPGWKERPFHMVKFRTMTNARDSNGELLPDAERLPRFGQLLRSTSLDELPELLNVLKGEMSLVGPRPLLMQYLERYSSEQRRRHEMRPGITGWAQVNGRNNLGWDDRFKLDVWYIDNWSFGLDLKILFKTVMKVIRRSDVSQEGHVTMTEFQGGSQEAP